MATPLTLGPGIQIGAGITLGSLPPAPPAASGSLLFNGTNNLSLPNNSAFDQNAGAWTVECFAYPTQSIGQIYNQDVAAFLGIYRQNSKFVVTRAGSVLIQSVDTFPSNDWYHLAVVYNGTDTVTLYVDGINVGTANPGAMAVSSTVTLIGRYSVGYGDVNFSGNLSNFRVVKGVAVYTGNFTVPTAPLTVTQSSGTNISAITPGQTQLLLNTAAPDYFLDASTNAFTVTNVGSVATSTDNPF
jgi:hypothetical protein